VIPQAGKVAFAIRSCTLLVDRSMRVVLTIYKCIVADPIKHSLCSMDGMRALLYAAAA
jgi:hypothetical protein